MLTPALKVATLPAAILIGSAIGLGAPAVAPIAASWVDGVVIGLVAIVLFDFKLHPVNSRRESSILLAVAWSVNFLVIPALAFLLASLFLPVEHLLFLGVVIYLCAPCTDWFLAFTRMAGGNTSLGAALIPINLLSQLLLYPVYLWLFAATHVSVTPSSIVGTLVQWFVFPVGIAVVARLLMRLMNSSVQARISQAAAGSVPYVTGLLVALIFVANITTIYRNSGKFFIVLCAVVTFFILVYGLADALSRLLRLAYPEQVLLVMTTAARNAPLMLAITTVALPNQPLVYAAIIIGMLIEFPHLVVIKHLLLRRRALQLTSSDREGQYGNPSRELDRPTAPGK